MKDNAMPLIGAPVELAEPAKVRESALNSTVNVMPSRRQADARRVLDDAYKFKCCAVCGLQIAASLQVAHLDHDAKNNTKENLARLCPTHHGMYDAGLYPIEAIRMLQDHWQTTEGRPDHKPRMKDAGAKAAAKRKRRVAAAKAVVTRLANAAKNSGQT